MERRGILMTLGPTEISAKVVRALEITNVEANPIRIAGIERLPPLL